MARNNCGKRIKFSFVDLNLWIDEYHTGVVQFQCAVWQNLELSTDWTSYLRENSIFASTSTYCLLHQMLFAKFSQCN